MTTRCRLRWSRFGSIALVLSLFGAGDVQAWGPRGHRVATKIAEERLTPEAKKAIQALLLDGDTLADLASWADHEGHDVEPNSATWHYVNIPITTAHYNPRNGSKTDGVVNKIAHFRQVLKDPKVSKRDRTRALLFFMHFIEDVHQPLHVGDNQDRGGNLTQVQYFNEGLNLHRIWDSSIIENTSRDDRTWLRAIEPLITPEHLAEWSKGGPEQWADESLQDAKLAYYFPKGARQPLKTGASLGPDYSEMALPIIRLQLAKAGVRLANELNAVFSETGSPAKPSTSPKAKNAEPTKKRQTVGAGRN